MAVLLLVALWLPATLHCDFEAVGFEEWFHCAVDHHSADESGETSGDACDVVENGWIKPASTDVTLHAPTLHACLISILLNARSSLREATRPLVGAETAAPPELERVWQFRRRAALPTRAPAIF